MKKQYLVDIFILLSVIFILPGCSTVSKTDISEQFIKTTIDSANDYISKGEYDLALEVYNSALKSISDYRLIYNKSIVLAYMGNYAEAAEICKKGFEEYNYIISFKTAQAYYYTLESNNEKACEVYLEILDLNPYDTTTRNNLISAYKELGMYEQALEQAYIMWNQGYKTSNNLSLIKELQEVFAK